MPGLFVHQSLDLTSLAQSLAEALAIPHGKPFHKDIILVDGKGVSNWLTHGIIRDGKLGVQMNADLMNSRRLAPWLASAVRGESPKEFPHDPLRSLAPRLYALLEPDSGEWRTWSGDPATDGGTVLWGLCVRLARHYGELLRNDPDWIARAESGAALDRWSNLWRRAIAGLRDDFAASRPGADASVLHEADLLAALTRPEARAAVASRLPGRICLVSTGDVSRSHLKLLALLRDDIEVRLFLLQPSQGFLDDLQVYETDADKDADLPDRSQSFRLLTACGRHYRLQQEKVLDELQPDEERFLEPASRSAADQSLLGRIKAGVDAFHAPLPVGPSDTSLAIHRCHGAWREAEVVRDELLRLFTELPDLRQGDILILSPDPQVHAPLLAGVLGAREPSFHFATANLYGLRKSPVGNLVRALLALPLGRLSSLELHSLLSLEIVRDHAGWTDSTLDEIEDWFRLAPFLWGLNATHRAAVQLANPTPDASPLSSAPSALSAPSATSGSSATPSPSPLDPSIAHVGTLDEFIRRLALGTAFGGRVDLIQGSLPLDQVEGQQDLHLAADLLAVLRLVRDWTAFALDPHPMADWVQAFAKVARGLRPRSREYLEEFTELNGAINQLEARARMLGEAEVTPQLFAQLAEDACDFESGSGQFMSGRVTLAPLRAASLHPARVIVLMGMNDGAFPGRSGQIGPEVFIDTAKPTFAKRALEAGEDTAMHAFLLALLAAKDRLVITFDGYVGSEGKQASAALPVEILRGVAEAHTEGSQRFAYHTHGLLAHQRPLAAGGKPLGITRDPVVKAVAQGLSDPPTPVLAPALPRPAADLTLAEWIRFWESPPRQALRQLGIHIPWQKSVLPTVQPVSGDAETSHAAEQWVSRARGRKKMPSWDTAKHAGVFPPAPEGPLLLDILLNEDTQGEAAVLSRLASALGISVETLIADEIRPYKTDRFRAFVHEDTLAVAILSRLDESRHVYPWFAVLPALAHERQRPIASLIVAGIKKPTDKQLADALESGGAPDISGQAIRLAVDPERLAPLRAGLIRLMDAATAADTPLMPKTFHEAVRQRFVNPAKSVQVGDDQLRGVDQDRGDISDPKARILVPEEYDFPALAHAVTELLPDGGARTTDQDVPGYSKPSKAKKPADDAPADPSKPAKAPKAKSPRKTKENPES